MKGGGVGVGKKIRVKRKFGENLVWGDTSSGPDLLLIYYQFSTQFSTDISTGILLGRDSSRDPV
jgi:hypothetical protein